MSLDLSICSWSVFMYLTQNGTLPHLWKYMEFANFLQEPMLYLKSKGQLLAMLLTVQLRQCLYSI